MATTPTSNLGAVYVSDGLAALDGNNKMLWFYQSDEANTTDVASVSLISKDGIEVLAASDAPDGTTGELGAANPYEAPIRGKLSGAPDLVFEDPAVNTVIQAPTDHDVVVLEGFIVSSGDRVQDCGLPQVANQTANGNSTLTWTNLHGAFSTDVEPAFTSGDAAEVTHYLQLSDFDIQIPQSAIIEGIEVHVTRRIADGNLTSETGQFRKYYRQLWNPSYDITWAAVGTPPGFTAPRGSAIAWSPDLGQFVAVAYNAIATSTDGNVWTARTSPSAKSWNAVVWADTLNLWVAVAADSGASNYAMTSPDGVTWTHRATPDGNWADVAWSSADGVLLAVNDSTLNANDAMSSTDGTTWTGRDGSLAPPLGDWDYGVAYSSTLDLFVAAGDRDSYFKVMTSSNGTTLTNTATGSNDFAASGRQIRWIGSPVNKFVMGQISATYGMVYSANGTSWTTIDTSVFESSPNILDIAYDSTSGYAVTITDTAKVLTSTDGATWSQLTTPGPASAQWRSIVYAPSLNKFVAMSTSGAYYLGTPS